jgi:hypothetical protein
VIAGVSLPATFQLQPLPRFFLPYFSFFLTNNPEVRANYKDKNKAGIMKLPVKVQNL